MKASASGSTGLGHYLPTVSEPGVQPISANTRNGGGTSADSAG